jgi:spore coat-associated protein N
MDRVRLAIGSHRWLLLASLALLTLALGTAMFSGASFSSRSANSAALAAGSIQLGSSTNQAIVAASDMKPGQSREGTIKIKNEGNVAGIVTLTTTGLSGAALAAVIDLKVDDITSGTTQKWSGKLDTFPAAGVSLGSFAADLTRTYRITLSWPSASNGASLQGTSTSLTFQWIGSWSAP